VRYPTLVRQDRQYKNQYKKKVEWKDLPIYVCRVGRSSLLIYCSSIIGVGRRGRLSYYYILFNPCDSKQCYSSLSIRAISNPRSPGMQESIQAARMEGLGEHIRCRFLDIISLLIYSHPLSSYVCGVGRRGMLLFLSIITYMRDLDAVLHTLPEQFSSNTCAELQEKSGSTTLFLPRT